MSSHAAQPHVGVSKPAETPGGVAPDDAGALTKKASAGMAWLMAQTLGYKILSLFGTIYLTHLIDPEHLGQMTLALGVAAFTNFLQQPGLREVLVQRRARSPHWDEPALPLSLAFGVGAGVLTALAGPLGAWFWNSPGLVWLLLILAVQAPLSGLSVVPEAMLQSQLRFRAIAVLEFVRAVGLLLSQIGLAFALSSAGHREWGAFALAAPVPVWAMFRCAGLWLAARPQVRWRPRPRLWRYLWTDSAKLFAASLVGLFISQGSLFVLGRWYDDRVVGLYAFAFNLSLITAVMLTQNIAMVVFPVLSTMQDQPERLLRVFLRSGRLLNMIAVPLCLLQGALAEPFIRTVCQPKWAGSVEIMQALSVAMAFVVIWPSSRSLMQAQGRYNLALVMQCLHATLFMSAVIVAARLGQGLAVAIGVACVYAFIGIVDPFMGIRPLGGRLRDVLALFAGPSIAGLLGVVAPALAARALFPADREWIPGLSGAFTTAYLPQAALACMASAVTCVLVYRVVMPHELRELVGLGAKMLERVSGRFRR
ncbi:MAG: oligosaccharide flippase family protein [Phycisphaerales bacterium]